MYSKTSDAAKALLTPLFVFFSMQIIGPLEEREVFNQDDFLLLESIILKTSGERIKGKIQQLGIVEDRYAKTNPCNRLQTLFLVD